MNKIAYTFADIAKVKKKGVKVMSTFSCGGGSSIGYKLAGCDVIAANDIDEEMAHHYKLNIDPPHYYLCPINKLKTMEIPKELYSLDILDGSPPCSTFSTSGLREKSWGKDKMFREGQAKQVLSDLFFDYLDLVEHLKPKVSIAENVSGMIKGNAKGYCKLIFARYNEIGYDVQLFSINAADCGVPQSRQRVFFCAVRKDLSKGKLKLAPAIDHVSCKEATSDLIFTDEELLTVKHTMKTDLENWPHTRQGGGYDEHCKKTGFKNKLWNHRRLHGDKPSCTITARFERFNHWSQPRKLTTKEIIRLGGFPDDYKFRNYKISGYMIGMSVPPTMTKVVADAVISQWLSGSLE